MKANERIVLEWLASEDTGISSECLAFEYLGITPKRISGPLDPSDLGRCLRLIAKVPEIRRCVDSLAVKHSSWRAAAKHWDSAAESMANEVGIDWSKGDRASKTYHLMKSAGF